MREIKFRAWDKILRYWLNCEDMAVIPLNDKSKYYSFGGKEDIIFCQYTGLLDKNGIEIYEGDILKHHKYDLLLKVIWNQNSCGWQAIGNSSFFLSKLCCPYIEIIGNIYENPELLKG